MGDFLSFLYLFFLLFIHEVGHFLTAGLFGCMLYQICFYPFGGVSKFQMDFNLSIKKELCILLAGPCFQMIGYLILQSFPMTDSHFLLLKSIHYSLLCFNLLPIYPLDGGRLFLLFFQSFHSFYHSFCIVFYASFLFNFFFFAVFLFTKQLNYLFIFLMLSYILFKEREKLGFYFDKFLLERYLKNYQFSKGIIVQTTKQFRRNRRHLIYQNKRYYEEREFLRNYFEKIEGK